MPTAMEKKLWELLIEDQIISQEELDGAITTQKGTGKSLVRTLIDSGSVTEWEMAATLGKQLNVPFITLSHYEIDQEVLECIPEDIVRKYRIVPVDRSDETLTVALSDPSNIYLLDELRLLTRRQIIPVISFESDINDAIERCYGNDGGNFEEALKDITDEDVKIIESESGASDGAEDSEDRELSVQADDAPVVQLVNLFVSEAIKMGASDIHIEPYEKRCAFATAWTVCFRK